MRRRALIIGISEYDRLARISFCQNDGNGMYEVLRWAGYDIPNYNKLTGYVNWESMRSTTIDFFIDHSISNDDILVFYYSGHGVQDVYGEIYLAPSEIDPDSPYKNGFSFGELTKIAQKSVAKKVVLILDCCYSGSAKIGKRFEIATDGEGICILAASQAYQEAAELLEKNHSVFTYYLIQGLRGKGLEVFDHSGNITVDTLSSYIYKKITSLPLEKRPKQRPLRKIEASEDIIIVNSDHFPKLKKLSRTFSEKESKQEYKDLPAISYEEVIKKFSPGVTLTKVEKTFRSDFVSVLCDVLAPHGLDIKDEIRMTIYGEPARSPDLLILERGRYQETDNVLHIHPGGLKAIIETKHPKKFATLGFMKLIDYCKLVSPDVGFVTNFKELIEYRLDDHGRPSIIPQTLGSKADNTTFRKIAAFILHEIQNPPPKLKEISDENLVKVLQNCLTDIQSFFVGDVSELANTLGIFQISHDRDLFKTEEQHKPHLQDLIRKAASFVILNQIVFYIALERKTSLVEQIENLSSLNELQEKFDHISKTIDYKAVFGARVVSSLPSAALEIINALISNLEALNFYDIKREILGKIYHNLIPNSIRKRIAAYYTSNTACELLARLTIKGGAETILDPSCGSGGFLIAAYKVKNELSNQELKHRDLIHSLYGFDISIFASHLSVINLTLQDLRNRTDEVYVAVDDAFNQLPAKTIELLESAPTDSPVATIDGISSKEKVLPSFHVVLMNPPFTRIERLEDNYKDYLTGSNGKFREFDQYFKGQSGLHCFFLVHIKHFLRDQGRFGAVLPASTFSSEYGEKLKPFILENYRILYLFTYQSLSTFSVGCDFKEILLVGVKGRKEAQSSWNAKVVVLKRELEHNQVESLANQIQLIENEVDTPIYSVRIVPKHAFKNERNWMTFTRPRPLREFIEKLRNNKAIGKQSDIIQFHQGHHIDAPHFFRLPNKYWDVKQAGDIFVTISEKVTKRELNIPRRYLISTLDVPNMHRQISAKMTSYIVGIPESEAENRIPGDVMEYIKWGSTFKKESKELKIPDLYKVSNYVKSGNRWYTYGHHILYRKDSFTNENILIGGRLAIVEKFRTKERECITLYSNERLTGSWSYFFGIIKSLRGLSIVDRYNKSQVLQAERILAAWFSSTLFLALYMYYRREISGDWGRIKIGDMTTFPCINPTSISDENKRSILMEFDAVRQKQLPMIHEQLKTRSLRKLDEAILRAIGIADFGMLLDNLYTDLLQELDRSEINEE